MAVGSLFVWCRPDIAWSSLSLAVRGRCPGNGRRQRNVHGLSWSESPLARRCLPTLGEAKPRGSVACVDLRRTALQPRMRTLGSHAASRFQADPTRNPVNLSSRSGKNSGKEKTVRDLDSDRATTEMKVLCVSA